MFHSSLRAKSRKTASTNHNLSKRNESRSEESNRGPSAYQPIAFFSSSFFLSFFNRWAKLDHSVVDTWSVGVRAAGSSGRTVILSAMEVAGECFFGSAIDS